MSHKQQNLSCKWMKWRWALTADWRPLFHHCIIAASPWRRESNTLIWLWPVAIHMKVSYFINSEKKVLGARLSKSSRTWDMIGSGSWTLMAARLPDPIGTAFQSTSPNKRSLQLNIICPKLRYEQDCICIGHSSKTSGTFKIEKDSHGRRTYNFVFRCTHGLGTCPQ